MSVVLIESRIVLQVDVHSADEPLTRRPGGDPHPAGPLMVLGQRAAAVPPARRYRHRPAGLQVLLSDYDHAVAERIRIDHCLAVSQVTAAPGSYESGPLKWCTVTAGAPRRSWIMATTESEAREIRSVVSAAIHRHWGLFLLEG